MWYQIKEKVFVFITQYKWWLVAQGLTIFCCVSLGLTVLSPKNETQSSQETETGENSSIKNDIAGTQSPSKIDMKRAELEYSQTNSQNHTIGYVEVKGQVKSPGIYKLSADMRIKDAIQLAGGVTTKGDLRTINQAQKITDEMVIYIPKFGEIVEGINNELQATDVHDKAQPNKAALVNINQASESELMSLPGVGQKRAQDIIAYREMTPFKAITDLGKVSGVGPKMLDKLSSMVTV